MLIRTYKNDIARLIRTDKLSAPASEILLRLIKSLSLFAGEDSNNQEHSSVKTKEAAIAVQPSFSL